MKDYEKIRIFDHKKVFDIERVKKALTLIGNPQASLKVIHVAGTKGKTSTCFYLSDLIRFNTKSKVGLFISPHLYSPTERIIINKDQIPGNKMETLMKKIKEKTEKKGIFLTYFELLTLVAFSYFHEERVDYVILETGLGGRFDATNVIKPILSVITRIDKDHTQILGKNLFKIAYEKLGILKKNVHFIIGKQKLSIYFFIFFFVLLKGLVAKWYIKKIKIRRVDKRVVNLYNKRFKLSFSGPLYSVENFESALKAFLFLFGEKELKIKSYASVLNGKFETYKLYNKHIVIFDTAHNKVAVKALVSSLKNLDFSKKFTIIFNCQKDKDYKGMIKILRKISSSFIVPDLHNLATKEIGNYLKKKKIFHSIVSLESVSLPSTDYLITGSFYIIKPVKVIFEERFRQNFIKYDFFNFSL